PPMKPKTTTEKINELKPGSLHGAFFSHSKVPLVYPRNRCPSSIPAGTVKPWIMLASTAMYMKYEVFITFHAELNPGSTSRWCAEAMEMNSTYNTKAVRLIFSLRTTPPTVSAASMYQRETIAATLICCELWPSAHQTMRYICGSTSINPI